MLSRTAPDRLLMRAVGGAVVIGSLLVAVAGCTKSEQGSAEKLCAAVRADPSASTLFAGLDPSDAPHALDKLRQARLTLGTLRSAAPDEVRDDLDVEIAYVQDLIDALAADPDLDAAAAADVWRKVTADHPEVSKANDALTAFSQANCASG